MAGPIATLRVMLSADDAEMRKGLGRSDKASKKWAAAQKRRNKAVAKSFKNIGVAVVGLTVAYGAMTKKAIEAADKLAKQARTIGITVEALQEYTFAAERSGVSTEEMIKGLQQFNKFMGQAARGVGTAKTAFEDMGIAIKDENGILRSQTDLMNEFVDAIAQIESPMMRAGLASDVFGRAGVKMLPMLADGTEGLEKMKAMAHELGVVMDSETALKAEILNDKIGALSEGISTKLHTAMVNFANDNADSFVLLLNIAEATFEGIVGGMRVVQMTATALAGVVVKLAGLVVSAFTSLGRGIGKGVAIFVAGAKRLYVEAKIASKKLVLGILEGYNDVVDTNNPAAKKLLSFFGLSETDTTGLKQQITNLEAHSVKLGQAMAAGMSTSISGTENNPVFAAVDGLANVLIENARTAGTKAGENFKQAMAVATNGGMASAVNANITGSDQAPGETNGSGGLSIEAEMEAQARAEKLAKDTIKWEKHIQDGKKKTHEMTLGFLTAQTTKGSAAAKVMAAINTALAISQIMTSTQAASMRAMADLGPIAGAPVAASIQAQGAVSMGIAAANGVLGQFHDGIDNVPNTGTYLLEKGERVVDKRLNEDLKTALASGGGVSGGSNSLSITVNGMSDADAVNRVINEQRPQFEQMLREINTDRAGQGLL